MTGATLDFVPTPAAGVESCELDGERLVWQGDILYRLDAVGSVVWECFDGHATLANLGMTLAEAFGAEQHKVQQDLTALCAELLDQGLLEGGRPRTLEAPPIMRIGRLPSTPLDPSADLPFVLGPFRAIDYDFAIRTDDDGLAAYFDRTLRSFAATGSPARLYSVVSSADSSEDRYHLYLDDEGIFACREADSLVRYMLWHVNYAVINGSSRHLLIHAAGARLGEHAVVLPGEMNAGKTTLVAGLVLDGLQLLTDELVALNLDTGLVDAYPRPLNLEPGSWEVLSELRPPDRDENDPLPRRLWHVDPGSIRPDAVASPTLIRWVIAPRFEPGSPTRLERLSRAGAIELLYQNAFNKHRLGSTGIRALIKAVQGARCARLVNGDLAKAVASVRRFIEDPE